MEPSKPNVLSLFPGVSQLKVPSVLTSASLCLGSAGVLLALQGRITYAILCLILAVPLDVFDGALARLLKQGTAFGAELDSLADLVSFVLLPVSIAWALLAPGVGGIGLLLLYVLGGAWRLAHFNAHSLGGSGDFEGIPTPYMACLVALALGARHGLGDGLWQAIVWVILALGPWLMLSALPFKKGGLHYKAMWLLMPCLAGLEVMLGG